jgi:thymidine phosphorylase
MRGGYISRCDSRVVGEVIRDLGGGRLTKDTVIQTDVGVDMMFKPGERVNPEHSLCRIHARTEREADNAAERLRTAFEFSFKRPVIPPLIVEVIDSALAAGQ